MLTGHVHQAPLAEGGSWIARSGATWIVNPGRQIGTVPCHSVIDLAVGISGSVAALLMAWIAWARRPAA